MAIQRTTKLSWLTADNFIEALMLLGLCTHETYIRLPIGVFEDLIAKFRKG
jgi:hypothetical protein